MWGFEKISGGWFMVVMSDLSNYYETLENKVLHDVYTLDQHRLPCHSLAATNACFMADDYDAFRAVLREAKHIVVLAGAGLSAASGVFY